MLARSREVRRVQIRRLAAPRPVRGRLGTVLAASAITAGVLAAPALASFPATGTVVEGKGVPGVALGATRAHAYSAWGKPTFCQSTGNAFCTWQRSNGAVDLSFQAANGGVATGTGNDVVAGADYSGLPGWKTTTGVTTANALSNPESVPPKYPGATVERYGDGHLKYVADPARGIDIYWVPQTYSDTFYVFIEIFHPR